VKRLTALAVSAALGGCFRPPTSVAELELPASIVWLAALSVDDDGALLSTTGVLRRDGEATWATLERAPGDVVVLGWTDEALASVIGDTSDEALASSRLVAADASAPALPSADFAARGTPSAGEGRWSRDTGVLPGLSAPWLPTCPPVIGAQAVLDIRCPACWATASQRGCRVQLEPRQCGVGALAATVDGAGTLVFDSTEFLSRCELTTTSSRASRSYDCQGRGSDRCAVDVFAGEFEPAFEVVRVPVVRGVVPVENFGRKLRNVPVHGYLAGLVPLAREVVTASFTTPTDWTCAEDPTVVDPTSTLHFVDVDDPTRVRTATAPPCVTHLLDDPLGDGFLAVFGRGPQSIARFDARGREQQRAVLAEVDRDTTWVVAARATEDGQHIGLARMNATRVDAVSTLQVIDARTFALELPPTALADRADTLVTAGPRAFVFFESDDAGSVQIDVDGTSSRVLERQPACGLPSDALSELGVAHATRAGGRGALLSARARTPTLLWVDVDQDTCQPMATFDRDLEPYAAVVTADGRWGAYAGITFENDAFIGLIDVAERRILPGATAAGLGVITQLVEDGDGALWALGTSEGSVSRIRRR
jgi:hypothetical protein